MKKKLFFCMLIAGLLFSGGTAMAQFVFEKALLDATGFPAEQGWPNVSGVTTEQTFSITFEDENEYEFKYLTNATTLLVPETSLGLKNGNVGTMYLEFPHNIDMDYKIEATVLNAPKSELILYISDDDGATWAEFEKIGVMVDPGPAIQAGTVCTSKTIPANSLIRMVSTGSSAINLSSLKIIITLPPILLDATLFPAEQGWPSVSGLTTEQTFPITFEDKNEYEFKYLTNATTLLAPGTSLGLKNGNVGTMYLEFPHNIDMDYKIEATVLNAPKSELILYISDDDGATWAEFEKIGVMVDPGPAIQAGTVCTSKTIPANSLIRMVSVGSSAVNLSSLKFIAVLDAPALAAEGPLYPANGATNASVLTDFFTATFDKKVQAGKGDITVNGVAIPVTECTFIDEMLKIPTAPIKEASGSEYNLELDTEYSIIIPEGAVVDKSGNAFAGIDGTDVVWWFKTNPTIGSDADIADFGGFGWRQIGDAVIDADKATIDVVLMFGTSLNTGVNIAHIVKPAITLSDENAELITELPAVFDNPQVITVKAENDTEKDWTINFSWAPLEPTTLPFALLGEADMVGKNIEQTTGFAPTVTDVWNNQSGTNLQTTDYKWYAIPFSQAGQTATVHWDGEASMVSFRTKYNNLDNNYAFILEESVTGGDAEEDWNEIAHFNNVADEGNQVPTVNGMLGLRAYAVDKDSRYLRWRYATRGNTSFYVDDIVIEKADCSTTMKLAESSKIVYSNNDGKITLTFEEPVLSNKYMTGIKLNGSPLYEDQIRFTRDGQMIIMASVRAGDENTISFPAGTIKNLKDICGGMEYEDFEISFTTDDSGEGEADLPTGIITPVSEYGNIIKSQIFTIQGIEVPYPTVAGVYIIKNIYDNGNVKTKKVVIK